MASIPPVGSNSVNTANGSFEKAMQGDSSVGVATSGGGKGGLSGEFSSAPGPDGSIKGGATGDFFGDAATKLPIGDDLFE